MLSSVIKNISKQSTYSRYTYYVLTIIGILFFLFSFLDDCLFYFFYLFVFLFCFVLLLSSVKWKENNADVEYIIVNVLFYYYTTYTQIHVCCYILSTLTNERNERTDIVLLSSLWETNMNMNMNMNTNTNTNTESFRFVFYGFENTIVIYTFVWYAYIGIIIIILILILIIIIVIFDVYKLFFYTAGDLCLVVEFLSRLLVYSFAVLVSCCCCLLITVVVIRYSILIYSWSLFVEAGVGWNIARQVYCDCKYRSFMIRMIVRYCTVWQSLNATIIKFVTQSFLGCVTIIWLESS